MTRQPGCHSDRVPGRRAPWWSVSTRCGAHNGYMDEALAGIVACWDGPKYKHFMASRIDTARALLAKYDDTGDHQ